MGLRGFWPDSWPGKNKNKIKELETQIEALSKKRADTVKMIPKVDVLKPNDLPPLERDSNGLYKIVCPYCLTKFEIGDLLYRATVVENGNVVIENSFDREHDQAYFGHWDSVGAIGFEANRSHILNMDPGAGEIESVTLIVKENGKDVQITRPYNDETMELMKRYPVVYVTDKYTHKSPVRICPHCHTELPAKLGFYPNYVFSLIGNSGCGKSVYLLRLVDSLCSGKFMQNSYMGSVINDESTELCYKTETLAEEVFRPSTNPMSAATDVGYIRPVIIKLINRSTLQEIYISLFDFPGEAVWQTDNTFFKDLAEKNFENSSGWLFMFDSGSLTKVNQALDDDKKQIDFETAHLEQKAGPEKVLNQVYEAYAYGHTFQKPIAFILSKSDMIKSCLEDLKGNYISGNPRLLRNPNPHKRVNLTDLFLCEEEIRYMLHDSSVTVNGDVYCNRNCAWFAISSTTVPVVYGCIEEGTYPSGLRETDPLEWLLYRCGQLEGEITNEENRTEDVEKWATQLQIPDMETHLNNLRRVEEINQKINELQIEISNLKK